MVDMTQLLLSLVILVLTSMLAIIGIQVYFILREFRATLQKANKVLDDTGVISQSVSKPLSLLSTLLVSLKGGSSLLKALTREKK